MMREIFLGKTVHWGLLLISGGILWVVGINHFHTSQFNLFATISLLLGIGVVAGIVLPHNAGDRITRDPIDLTDDKA